MLNKIAVFGNGGAGKTTVSLALGNELTRHNRNVVILSPDKVVPALPIYLPRQDFEPKHSIGVFFASDNAREDAFKDKIHFHKKNRNMAFMGLVSGETNLTYDEFTKEDYFALVDFVSKMPFDYLIVDCTSNLMSDLLSLIAVETADTVVRVLSPDIAGIEYDKSTDAWQGGGINFKPEEQIRILNRTSKTLPTPELISVIEPDLVLPFSVEVQNKVIAGELLKGFDYKDGVCFENRIRELGAKMLRREKIFDE